MLKRLGKTLYVNQVMPWAFEPEREGLVRAVKIWATAQVGLRTLRVFWWPALGAAFGAHLVKKVWSDDG